MLILGVATCHQSYTIFAKGFGQSFNIFSIEMKWLRKMEAFSIRPDQLDFSFRGPAGMVFFSNWNKNIIKVKNTLKSLLETKIWFMLSFINNRRNIACFCDQQRWLTKSTFSHMVTRVTCLRCSCYDRNESKSWTLFTSIKHF